MNAEIVAVTPTLNASSDWTRNSGSCLSATAASRKPSTSTAKTYPKTTSRVCHRRRGACSPQPQAAVTDLCRAPVPVRYVVVAVPTQE